MILSYKQTYELRMPITYTYKSSNKPYNKYST